MDLKKPGTSSADTEEATSKPEEPLKTPSRPGKGVKRKYQSPATPSSKPDVEKPGSAKKRRKSTSATPLGWSASPGAGTPLKPPMTERQQMALLLQLTDPQKQPSVDQSPLSSSVEVTPKSRTQRRNERGETPLHIACIKGDLKTATSLVEQGAEVDSIDNAGWTPLHEACNHGHAVIVAMLLQRGAKVNVRGMEGDTPMHDAVVNKHLECVKLLLEHGGDPTVANDKGQTPIEISVPNPNIFKVLSASVKDDSEPDVFESSEEKPTGDEHLNKKVYEENPIAVTPSSKHEHDKDETKMSESGSSPVLKEMDTSDVDADSKRVGPSRKRGRGLVFSDISSSESESEHSEMITRRGGKRSRLSFPNPKQQLEKLSEDEEGTSDLKDKSSTMEVPQENKNQNKSVEPLSDGACAMETKASTSEALSSLSTSPPVNTQPPTTKEHEQDKTKDSEIQSKLSSSSERDQPCSSPLPIEPIIDHSQSSEHKLSTSKSREQTQETVQSAEKMSGKQLKETERDTKSPPISTDVGPLLRAKQSHTPLHVASRALVSRAVKSPQPSMSMRTTRSSLIVSFSLSLVKVSGLDDAAGEEGDETMDRDLSESQEDSLKSVELADLGEHQAKEKDHVTKESPTLKSDARLQIRESVPERRDSTSSQGSTSGEKHTKHSRKPQHVFPSRKLAAKKEEPKIKSEPDKTNASNSFSISLDWGVLPQQSPKSGVVSPKLIVQSSGTSSSGGSTLHVHGSGKKVCGESEEKSDDSDTSKSTVISLSTSLPIVFSGLRDTQQTVTTSSSSSSPPKDSKQHQQQPPPPPPPPPPPASTEWNPVKDTLTTPTSVKPKTLPIILESMKSSSAPSTPQKREKNSSSVLVQPSTVSTISPKDTTMQSELEDVQVSTLPPKRRHRVVYSSAVAQQRRVKQNATPIKPAHLSSFLLSSGNYRSRKSIQPTNPKLVYPPMSTTLYKLFNEQESERVKLIAAHLTEQDRMVISMEQEVLRAHQRATRSHTVISACSLLLEQLLPRSHRERSSAGGDGPQLGSNQQPAETTNTTSPLSNKQKEEVAMEMLDSKLLSGLIQDVWDKFYQLKFSLLTRQRHEVEALWLVQRSTWKEKLSELGFSNSSTGQDVHVPSTHVPIASSKSLTEN